MIIGASFSGIPVRTLAKALSIGESTIRATIKKAPLRDNQASLPRTGQPLCTSKADERKLLRIVRLHPKWTWKKVMGEARLKYSLSTYKRILKDNGISNWRSKRRPMLTVDHAKARLAFALKYLGYGDDEWARIIWSDECSVERGTGKERTWVFCVPQQRYQPEMVETYKAGKGISLMVWAAFSGDGGRSELYVIERDPDSPRGGYSANSYIILLDDIMPTIYEPGLIFIQDNAPIYNAKKSKAWFAEHLIPVLE
jgi:transposase